MEEVSDADLLAMCRAGDGAAVEALFMRYQRYATSVVRTYFLAGADADDVRQEALIGLYKAIRDFDPTVGASFRSFAELCIKRQVVTAVKTATRRKHEPLNLAVSLSGGTHDTDTEGEHGEWRLRDRRGLSPEDHVLGREGGVELSRAIQRLLSSTEVEVLKLYMDGCSYEEINAALGHAGKTVSNALFRAKRKLGAYFLTDQTPSAVAS